MSRFDEVLTRAIADLEEHGYDSGERLAYWQQQLREQAEAYAKPFTDIGTQVREALSAEYRRLVDNGTILRRHPGVARFTLHKLAPDMRAQLQRRILASADLIKLNREDAIETTLRRLAGWMSSVPQGGSDVVKRREVKDHIKKPLQQLPFVQRRVLIDQGHKLNAGISEVIAQGTGALAGEWHSHYRQPGYNYRPDHKERDGTIYLLKGSWAMQQGLVKPGKAGYLDGITRPAEEPFCRCWVRWIYALRDLPPEMLTKKGRDALDKARAAV